MNTVHTAGGWMLLRTVALTLTLTLTLTIFGCGDDGGGTGDSGVGPDTSTSGDTGAGGDTGTGADTGTMGDTGTAADTGTTGDTGATGDTGTMSGACTNSADMAVVDATDIAAEAETCGRDCFGGAMCVTECMRDDVGLSMECASCFGDTASCTLENCLTACLGSDEARCTTCRRDAGCLDAFETCSGLPGE